MVIKSYSKINLTLRVNSKKENGLHEIQSLYCLIDLFDKIKIYKIKKNKDKISFSGPFSKLVKKKNNSVYNLLKKLRELKLISSNYSIMITKNIPVYGGLGGGTSNAFFILKHLLKNKVSKSLLEKLENIIGSDIKLFLYKKGFVKNLNKISYLKDKQKFYFVLVQPKIKCSTKEIYSKVKSFSNKENCIKKISKSRIELMEYLTKSRNDLQLIVEKNILLLENC